MLYYADIAKFDELPGYEIEKIELFDKLPDNWTYPEIQPKLLEKVDNIIGNLQRFIAINKERQNDMKRYYYIYKEDTRSRESWN